MKSLVGREIAGYQILNELGQGGGGVVYRAMQMSLRREVALKIIQEAQRGDDAAAQRFRRETALHLQLSHRNLVMVYDAGISEEGPYLAMELVDGQSLGRLLSTTPQPPLGWYFETLSTKQMLGHFDEEEGLLGKLEALPEEWKASPRGRLVILNVMFRTIDVVDAWIPRMDKPTAVQGRERLQRLVARSLDELARPGRLDFDGTNERASSLMWFTFNIASFGLDQCADDAARLKTAVDSLNRLASKQPYEGLPPRQDDDIQQSMMFIHEAARRRPDLGLDAELVKRAATFVVAEPEGGGLTDGL